MSEPDQGVVTSLSHSGDELALSDNKFDHAKDEDFTLTLPPKVETIDHSDEHPAIQDVLDSAARSASINNNSRKHDFIEQTDGTPRALAIKQFAAAIEEASSNHSEYCDILDRNMESNVMMALEQLRNVTATNAKYDVHLYGQRNWLTEEAKLWLCEDLPKELRAFSERFATMRATLSQAWEASVSVAKAREIDERLQEQTHDELLGLLKRQADVTVQHIINRCKLKLVSHVEAEARKIGLRSFSLDSTAEQLTRKEIGQPSQSTPLPSLISRIIKDRLAEQLSQQCVTTDREARAIASSSVGPKLDSLINNQFKPRIVETMAKMATNPYAVEEAVAMTIQNCLATVDAIRREMEPILGKIHPTTVNAFTTGIQGSPTLPSSSLHNTQGASFSESGTDAMTLLEEARHRQKESMVELLTEWRAIIEATWHARLASLRRYRERFGAREYLDRFSIEMGEPPIELPARLASLDATDEAPIEAIASLSNAGNFTLGLDESDLLMLLSTDHSPPDNQLWRELAGQLNRVGKSAGRAQCR